MRQDLLKTGQPDSRDLVEDDQSVGSDRPDRPDPSGLKGSRHARLDDHIRAPDDDLTLPEAETLCAEVTRAWLGDFAPALILLDAAPRRRLQAVLTLTRTAVDFALQPGVEGERVSALNRLHFEVESALDGDPRGQPAHLLIADEERRSAWQRAAWDELFDRLRHLSMVGSWTGEHIDRTALSIAELLAPPHGRELAPALTTSLVRAESWRIGDASLAAAASAGTSTSPKPWRRFSRYIDRAERRLRKREERGREPRLGLISRLGLLLRSRWA